MTPTIDHDGLGEFLRERRARLQPGAVGLPVGRRRTAGLRREEVAMRAGVSTTWYAWLEQGRRVRASADVIDRLATALRLGPAEREHLFLLAQGRPPPRDRATAAVGVSPRVRRLLDDLRHNPAYVFDACWNIVAWNAAASAVLTDYSKLPASRRNVLRQVFTNPLVRDRMPDWERDAAKVLAQFRGDLARNGPNPAADRLVAELSRESAPFAAWWRRRDVSGRGEGTKRMVHATAGPLTLDYVHTTLDDAPGLALVVFTPAGHADRARLDALVAGGR